MLQLLNLSALKGTRFLIHSSQLKGSSNRLLPAIPAASPLRHNQSNKMAEFIQALKHLVFFRQRIKNYKKFPLSNKCGDMGFKRAKVVACKALPNYHVWIRFDDGLEGKINLSNLVGKGVFKAWKSIDFFNQVRVDPKTDTLTWGDDIDLDPYVLRDQISQS